MGGNEGDGSMEPGEVVSSPPSNTSPPKAVWMLAGGLLVIVAVVVAIVFATGNNKPASVSAPTDPPATVSERQQRVDDCYRALSTALISAVTGHDDASLIQADRTLQQGFGIDSIEYRLFHDLLAKIQSVAIHKGDGAGVVEASNQADASCQRAYNSIITPPTSPTTPTTPSSGSASGSVGSTVLSWWAKDHQPAPDFLVKVNERWSSGEVPDPYASCALPGNLSAPSDWGQQGEVTLGKDPEGGWRLTWPGDHHQYIRVMTEGDVDSAPETLDLSGTPGVHKDGATFWNSGPLNLLHFDGSTCWVAWGISPDAPLGAQRAFLSGMILMQSAGAGHD